MSGGRYQHAYRKLDDFIEELESDIELNKYGFDDETIAGLKRILANTRQTQKEMKAAEWLMSGDVSSLEIL
jgi:hypothetical protein